MMAAYTMFPSNTDYVNVAKALILKYPFLKDIDGNGYHTWHMSLKRKFKTERAPLVDDTEVRKYKEKYAQSRKSQATDTSAAVKRNRAAAAALYDELDSMHSSIVPVYRRINDNLLAVLPKLLDLVKNSSPLKKMYQDARADALAQDHAAIDFRGAILLLPSIFREKIENLVIRGQSEPNTPYPTIQVKDQDWTTVFAGRSGSVIKVDGVEVCSCTGIEEAFNAVFCMYYVFNMEYPSHLKHTMAFFQRIIAQILDGEKLSTPVTRVVNLLY
ncbi:hypothetical protein PBY51_014601 [Eleginops maclovinus]|uniref:Uncharacterized protein n=1 Tax=Eleginops maclovinus TaxID=56733 RepID=A0AAN8A6R4_ELEMC|nr:hypothetical protein PBY51_014601 [Eleginops maclovinus]